MMAVFQQYFKNQKQEKQQQREKLLVRFSNENLVRRNWLFSLVILPVFNNNFYNQVSLYLKLDSGKGPHDLDWGDLCYQIKEIRVEPQASTRRSEQFVCYKTKKGTADHYDQNFKLCPKTMRSFVILKARLFSFFPLSDLIALRLNERWRWGIESCQKKIIPW